MKNQHLERFQRRKKHGIWTGNAENAPSHCSVCLENPLSITDNDGDVFTVLPNFCPHCGARMDGKGYKHNA